MIYKYSLLLCLLMGIQTAEAQDVISFDPRGLVLGLEVGAGTYSGDSGSAFDELNTGLGFEAHYSLSTRISAGVSFSTSKFGAFEESRNSLGLGTRLRLLTDRVSPFVDLGVHIVNGGERTGFGPLASVGIDFMAADRTSFYVKAGWRGSLPDEAVDAGNSDSSVDHLILFGVGARFRLTQPKRPRFAVDIHGPDTVLVGDLAVFTAGVTGDPSSEVFLAWDIDGIRSYRGPEVRYMFEYLGPQVVTVAGRNDRYEVRTRKQVVVVEDQKYRNPEDPLLGESPSNEGRVKLVEIYANRTPFAGEMVNFRARLSPGAVWPISYLWNMGDGSTQMGNNVLQRYDQPGNYTVAVIARNSRNIDTLTTQVEVRPRNESTAEKVEEPDPSSSSVGTAGPARVRYSPDELRGSTPVRQSGGGYGWVVASYLDASSAEQLMRQLRVRGYRAGVVVDHRVGASTAYRVVVGQFASTGRALSAKREVQRIINAPITIIDIASPATTVGSAPTARRRVPEPDTGKDVPETELAPANSETPAQNKNTDSMPEVSAAEPVAAGTARAGTVPESDADLNAGTAGPQLGGLRAYVRDQRLLLFIDGVKDPDSGVSRVEYRVFSATDEPLSSWSEVSLVPPGRSSYGLQMHRVPVPQGLSTEGGGVEVRAVNQAGGFTTISASIGTE
jgi:PKD repeat protein